MKQPDNALKAFDEALRRSPFHAGAEGLGVEFDARVAEGKASAYEQLGETDRAVSAQLEAVHLTPDTADRWAVLGELYQSAGRADKASRRSSTPRLSISRGGPFHLGRPLSALRGKIRCFGQFAMPKTVTSRVGGAARSGSLQ